MYLDYCSDVCLELSTILNEDLGLGGTTAAAHSLDCADHVHTLRHLAKDHVLTVEPDKLSIVCMTFCVRQRRRQSAKTTKENHDGVSDVSAKMISNRPPKAVDESIE
jgi:hypothetical protein